MTIPRNFASLAANTNTSGQITSSGLAATAVTAGTYGGNQLKYITVDAQGRITAAANVASSSFYYNGTSFLMGTATSYNTVAAQTAITPRFQVSGTSLSTASSGQYGWSATTPYLSFSVSNGAPGVYTTVAASDALGVVQFNGADGTSFVGSSSIRGAAEGTVSTGVVPGRLSFVTANTTGVLTERMRINSYGNTSIGTTTSTTKFYVAGSSASDISALTDGATITPDFTLSNNFSVTLGGNRTMANPTGLTIGQSGIIYITQDATGSRTLAWGTSWDWPNAGVPTLTTTANAVDAVVYTVRTATGIVAQFIPNIG